MAAALAVGCLGFSVREFDLAAPAAVLLAAAVQDRRHLSAYGLMGVCVLAICGAVYLWAGHVAGAQNEAFGAPTISSVRALAGALPSGAVVDFGNGCHDGSFFTAQEPPSLAFLARHLTPTLAPG